MTHASDVLVVLEISRDLSRKVEGLYVMEVTMK